jgi:hypothetical protein
MIKEKPVSPPPDPAQTEIFRRWLQDLWNNFPKMDSFTPNLIPVSVGAHSSSEQEFTVAGLNKQDVVTVNPPGFVAGIALGGARVADNGKIRIVFANVTAGALTPPAGVYAVYAIRR